MKRKILIAIPMVFICCLLLSAKAFALSGSDIGLEVCSPVNSLKNESGVVAIENFPAEIAISATATTGTLPDAQWEFNGQVREIPAEYVLRIENKEACGAYTITASTDNGAVLTITANVVFQVRATYDIRYRMVGMLLTEVYDGGEQIKSFPAPQYIRLKNANTVADSEKERIAGLIGKSDGKTYTLKGSLVVEVYNYANGKLISTYDTREDFDSLTTSFGWTPKCYTAFESMRFTALSYQAPVRISVDATWCDEKKQEIYGEISAQDKGVPEYLYPYQTTSVTFTKDDISLSRNFIYAGLEWDYTPDTAEYPDGENKAQTKITQKINTRIPAADFFFKFKKLDGNDLLVSIQAPQTVYRGDDYSFTVTYTNAGGQPVFEVPMEGKVDEARIKEIPGIQDFSPNESKNYEIKRTADTTADEIRLWAHIGIPKGVIDKNPDNNTATVVIRVIDPEPEPTSDPADNPDNPNDPDNPGNPDDPGNPPDDPPDLPNFCDLSANILAPPTVFADEDYSYTVRFTNHSTVNLNAVLIQAKNNGDILSQLPKSISLKPQEIKSYTLSGTAGSAGDVYLLWANVEAPEGFSDENPLNNTAMTKITVVEKPGDDPGDPNDPGDPSNPSDPNDPGAPDDPKDPGNPDEPDNPYRLCDLWVNLSYPPEIYTQEEYSFTVFYTNNTAKSLSKVVLQAAIDGAEVSAIPSAVDFKPHETKSFLIKGKAGEKEAVIPLFAQVLPPSDYTDLNMGNNQTSAEIMVTERSYDLDVQRITPSVYKENQTVISTIRVSNKGSLDFSPGEKVSVLFEVPELAIKKSITAVVMARDTWNTVSVKWDTPNVQADKSVTLIAAINSQASGNETSAANNTFTQRTIIKNVTYETPLESVTVPVPPQRSAISRLTWWEQRYENGGFVWKSYYAELKVTASLDYDTKPQGYIKSGYGFAINVTSSVETNYYKPELITVPQTAEVYLPQHRYETAIPLLRKGSRFTFRENPDSPFGHKRQYVPVWFPDNKSYVVQLLVTDVYTPAGVLSKWITGGDLQMKVVDSMYSDDATGGQ
jgi:hypothetical protein